MSSTKNPDHEAENPAPMPQSQQGHKAKMAPRHDAPPGLEQDSHGNTIPLDQRTEEDQQKARAAAQHKS
jgi:hypothetical protein